MGLVGMHHREGPRNQEGSCSEPRWGRERLRQEVEIEKKRKCHQEWLRPLREASTIERIADQPEAGR